MVKITPYDSLIVVDAQKDFLPGGALPVPEGDGVIDPKYSFRGFEFRICCIFS